MCFVPSCLCGELIMRILLVGHGKMGRLVGEATMGGGDSHNVSLALTARHLPIDHGQMFVLWAGESGSSIQVGRFMVDRTGSCRVRFNLPGNRSWRHFWVTEPERPRAIVAST